MPMKLPGRIKVHNSHHFDENVNVNKIRKEQQNQK